MAVSGTMRVVGHKPREPLFFEERPVPSPGPGEVLIKVEAAGINRPDLLQRGGFYPPPPGASDILGLEAAGEIAAVGEGTQRWRIGDKVTALLNGGGYALYAVAPGGQVLPAPSTLSLEEAAGLPETVFTVWANVFEDAALKPGERFLVHGGASGIGTTAIQMAAAHGAQVYATAGDAAKCALCARLGADRAINYKDEDYGAILAERGGVDVILDMVGAPYLARNIEVLRERGRLAYIAFLQGPRAEIDLSVVMRKRLTITGSTLRPRSTPEKARLGAAIEAHVWPWIEKGRLKPVIDMVFPISRVEEAHSRMAQGAHAGKIILKL
ncbi:MAG: NAD(P)H-quinone oxidoreductase [Alphaproteobacteria bacterium]|nr:NAD(P)H-quinone oxidoreductase [Alphaproteobacteria bacterium]